ncbi:MAG: NifU family protein [Verrucomicrobia bacterium]|nr:NifU family protein [Verrucomicrobiota bacterium]
MIKTFPWARYSRKLAMRIENPYCVGIFSVEDATERHLHLAKGSVGEIQAGNFLVFYWLVDPEDGVIIDARFQAFGNSALVGACEAACELVIGKNYDQARRMSAELLDRHLQDKSKLPAFPEETFAHLNLVVDGLERTAESCSGIPLAETYVAPPIAMHDIEVVEGGFPGWQELTAKQKMGVIESVLETEVRPYIELDAGGVEVVDLVNEKEVIIAYKGSCTSCHSATGATLSFIQQILRAKVFPDLDVIPQI